MEPLLVEFIECDHPDCRFSDLWIIVVLWINMTKLHVFPKNGYPKGMVNLEKEIIEDENIYFLLGPRAKESK